MTEKDGRQPRLTARLIDGGESDDSLPDGWMVQSHGVSVVYAAKRYSPTAVRYIYAESLSTLLLKLWVAEQQAGA